MDDETKKILISTGLSISRELGARKIYHTIFKRYDRPDYDLFPGLYEYNKVKSVLFRETLSFKSEGNKLNAYYYPCKEESKGLVVLVHGFRSGSDEYLPITMYLVSKSYNVFTYDGTGTYESEGKDLRGFLQGLVDLDNAINFLKSDKRFKRQNLYLLGHSCGGFAVNAVISLHKKDIKSVASIAAVNNCYTLLIDKASEYAKEFAEEGFQKEFLDRYQKKIFGKYARYDALMGVNSVSFPIFIAHGFSDKTISYDTQSLISHRKEITNPNVTFYTSTGNQGGHDSIWHSPRSNDYQDIVNSTIKSMKKDKVSEDDIKKYVNGIDHYLYSEIDNGLFDKILEVFDKA